MALRMRITTPFGAESTVAQVIDGVDLHDKRASVTGDAGVASYALDPVAGAGPCQLSLDLMIEGCAHPYARRMDSESNIVAVRA